MMRTARPVAMLTVLLLVMAGCARGSSSSVGVGASASAPVPEATVTSAARCIAGSATSRLSLTEADNGGRRCLSAAGLVEVYLHGTLADPWSPVELTGTALRRTPSGKGALPVGVTAGFFAATGPGEARLTAVRSPCTSPGGAGSGCDSAHFFLVTILVR
jgi:hypothetical protein